MDIYPVRPLPCPFCGESSEQRLKLQTPLCGDGIYHDAYLRCATCGTHGPSIAIDATAEKIGSVLVAPIVEKWNSRARI